MPDPITAAELACPMCGDGMATVAFRWPYDEEKKSRVPVVEQFSCENECTIGEEWTHDGRALARD